MSTEYDAALEVCGVLTNIDQNLDRMYADQSTARERIATACLAALLASNYLPPPEPPLSLGDIRARDAVWYADALFAELAKPQEEKS